MVLRFALLMVPRERSALFLPSKMNVFHRFVRSNVTHSLSKNIKLISVNGFADSPAGTSSSSLQPKRFKDESKPLVVMLTWLLAKKKHVNKYCDVYLKNGYNVMTVSISPWQFFWPLTGTKVVAGEVLKYLHSTNDRHLILHGFSIGAYVWAEVLVKMMTDIPKYQPIINNVKGQIWDSAADVTEATRGLPMAMFPRNALLRKTMEKYVDYHLRAFYDAATQHYVRASQLFHTSPIRAPTLFFVAKNDLVGTVNASMKARESYEANGVKVYWKCWEKSKHVSHMMFHREEYLAELLAFLREINSSSEHVKDKAQVVACKF